MRRPLNNGMPLSVAQGGPGVTVFDAAALDPNRSWRVTLFAWPSVGPADMWVLGTSPVANLQLQVLQANPTDSCVLWNRSSLQMQALFEGYVNQGQALQVADVVLRGNQSLVASCPVEVGTNALALYGYVVMDGVDPVPYAFRPLQPSNTLVAPFNAPFVSLDKTAGDLTAGYETAQLLNASYWDYVTLDISASIGGAVTDGKPRIRLPNGMRLPIPFLNAVGSLTLPVRIFDGIPLLAPSTTNNLLEVGFDSGDTTFNMTARATGHFTRGS
jgi:hypothetical protein